MITLIIFLALDAVVITLLALKVWDAVRAWRYNRREAKRRALDDAFCNGYQTAMGRYAHTYRVVLATPDRPKDPWLEMVREDIDELTETAE